MAKPVLIVKNASHEGPGLLELKLKKHSLPFEVIDLEAGDAIPSPKEYSAMIVMGGADSANDDTEKMKTEIKRIKEALKEDIPFLGVCLGLQVLVKAAGGKVVKNDVREVAFRSSDGTLYSAELTDEGTRDPLMAGLEESIPMFHLHGETVELTKEMKLLASGEWCINQIVRVASKAYGIQGHLELTDEMFAAWCKKDAWLKECDAEKLQDDWIARRTWLGDTVQILFGNFLGLAGLL